MSGCSWPEMFSQLSYYNINLLVGYTVTVLYSQLCANNAITCSALQWACWQCFVEPFGLHLSMLSSQQHWQVLCEHPSCGNGIGSLGEQSYWPVGNNIASLASYMWSQQGLENKLRGGKISFQEHIWYSSDATLRSRASNLLELVQSYSWHVLYYP